MALRGVDFSGAAGPALSAELDTPRGPVTLHSITTF
jgi:hypothetical protein